MATQPEKLRKFSRRSVLPVLGSTFLLPIFGLGRSTSNEITDLDKEAYQTLLKPDGTIVKVSVSTLKKSKIIKKKISNTSFLNWLGKKL